jgi:hypothetical protein
LTSNTLLTRLVFHLANSPVSSPPGAYTPPSTKYMASSRLHGLV